MMSKQSQVLMHMNGRLATKRGPVKLAQDAQVSYADLTALGVDVRAMDSALIGGGSGGVPGYVPRNVLETWLNGTLRAITSIRNIDRIAGVSTVGNWEDEAIRLRLEEGAGQAELYGDNTNIPLADIRTTVESRGIARFELGFRTGLLEAARMSAAGFDAMNSKRRAVQDALDVNRNAIGFKGFNSDDTNVYGLLNDPNLPAYNTYTETGEGFSNVAWASGTFDSLTKDFAAMFKQIVTQSGGHVQKNAAMVFVIPTNLMNILDQMHATTAVTVGEWIAKNYPNVRIENTPEFSSASGGNDVAYLFV